MSDFFRNLAEDLKDEDTSIAADGMGSAEYTGTVDTGSYIMNAVMSGSLYGGIPNNKITAFAGESSTGKTFFALSVIKQFLLDHPTGGCVYYDTEAAVTKEMMESRGLDTRRIIISEPQSIQRFRTHAIKTLEQYEKTPEKGRPPMLVTNHVYEVIGSYVPMKEMGGGSGLKYAASSIAFLSKKKERDGRDVIGNIIKVKMFKSRLSKENKEVECLLNYDTGLDRYYGLIELAVECGAWIQSANRIETEAGKVYPKVILKDPEKYFTSDVMAKIEEFVGNKFSYGGDVVDDREDDPEQSDSE